MKDVSFNFVRVCVLLRKTELYHKLFQSPTEAKFLQRPLSEDGIKVSPPSPRSSGASSIVGGRVEVCL